MRSISFSAAVSPAANSPLSCRELFRSIPCASWLRGVEPVKRAKGEMVYFSLAGGVRKVRYPQIRLVVQSDCRCFRRLARVFADYAGSLLRRDWRVETRRSAVFVVLMTPNFHAGYLHRDPLAVFSGLM